jgi:TonB family protein
MHRPWLIIFFMLTLALSTKGQPATIKLGILDFGASSQGKLGAEKLRNAFRSTGAVQIIDPDLCAAAAKGVGYSGSLNMSVTEAKDLGNAIESEFFILGDAQTVRRSSSKTPVYYESYNSLFVISARTGRLIFWDRLNAEAEDQQQAEEKLSRNFSESNTTLRCLEAIRKAQLEERKERAIGVDTTAPLIEDAPDDEKTAAAQGLRLPRPYRRLRPAYPESAAKADVEATVDVLVDVDANGEVNQIQVARWAGFGLDEITVATVRQLHFFPAMRNGTPIPMRVLLRYNFRKQSQ